MNTFTVGRWVSGKNGGPRLNRIMACNDDGTYTLDKWDGPVKADDLVLTRTGNNAVIYRIDDGSSDAVLAGRNALGRRRLLMWLQERVGTYEQIDESRIAFEEYDRELELPPDYGMFKWHFVVLSYTFLENGET